MAAYQQSERPAWATVLDVPAFPMCEKPQREFCYAFRKVVLKIVEDVMASGQGPLELADWLDLDGCMKLIAEDPQRCANAPLLDELLSPLSEEGYVDAYIETIFVSGMHDMLAWWGLCLPDLDNVVRCQIAKTLVLCMTRADGKAYSALLADKLSNVALFLADHLRLSNEKAATMTPKTPLDKAPLLCLTGFAAIRAHDPAAIVLVKAQNVATLAIQSFVLPAEAFPDAAAHTLHMVCSARLHMHLVQTPAEFAYSLCMPGAMDAIKPVLEWLFQAVFMHFRAVLPATAAKGAKGPPVPVAPPILPEKGDMPIPNKLAPFLRHIVTRLMFDSDPEAYTKCGEELPVAVEELELQNPAQFYKKLTLLGFRPLLNKMAEMADPKKGNYGGPYRDAFFEICTIVVQCLDLCKPKGKKGQPKDEEILPGLKKMRTALAELIPKHYPGMTNKEQKGLAAKFRKAVALAIDPPTKGAAAAAPVPVPATPQDGKRAEGEEEVVFRTAAEVAAAFRATAPLPPPTPPNVSPPPSAGGRKPADLADAAPEEEHHLMEGL